MTLKHASAYAYGTGSGIVIALSAVDQYTFHLWLLVGLVFTAAYAMDKRAQAND